MTERDWARVDAVCAAVLARHGGVARLEDFRTAGLTPRQVASAFRRGVLERPRIGWYVDPALPWQAKHAVRVGGVLTCCSAAATYGIPVPHGSWARLDVRVPVNAPRLRHHRDRTWHVGPGEDAEVEVHWAGPRGTVPGWRVDVVEALLEMCRCVDTDWFVAALDAALHRPRDAEPILSSAEFVRLVTLLPRRIRRALRLVDARAESCIETLLRLGLVRRGILPFDLQVWTRPDHRVDFVVRGRLILEADGEQYHDPETDAVRDALMRALGYVVLRFSYERIVFDLESVLDEIEAALASL